MNFDCQGVLLIARFFHWRNVRALWRLGSVFECACWSMMFFDLQCAARREYRTDPPSFMSHSNLPPKSRA